MRYLYDDVPVADVVARLLETEAPVMSWINLGEVFYVIRRGFGELAATSTIRELRDVVLAEVPDVSRVIGAGRIKSEFAMSYADAFAAATAQAHDAELWTGDPELLVADAPWRWRDLRSG